MSVSETRRQTAKFIPIARRVWTQLCAPVAIDAEPRSSRHAASASILPMGPNSGMRLTVVEVTKYTYLLTIVADGSRPRWLPEIEVKVRVYHDARMAEVIEWCSDRTIPWLLCESSGMQARDEKWQWNSF